MAVITPDRFTPLKRYVGVRLQQGVPIVDADWNELEDIRRFELRAFLKWFVGDGVPEGSDAFRIEALDPPLAHDVRIVRGTLSAPGGSSDLEVGLRFTGRCIVDGLDVIIQQDTTFRGQPLHTSQPGAASLAARLGTTPILEMPQLDGEVVLYLDVWEHLVTANDDPSLVLSGLGTESCARHQREWTVRARAGSAVPVPGDADFAAGHSYCGLALVTRRAADARVFPTDLRDQRHRRLLTPPATLIEDVLGTNVESYRRGEGRPVLPLRDAINALLRGELPSTPDQVIAPDPQDDDISRAFFLDSAGGVTVIWHSERVNGDEQVFGVTFSRDNLSTAATTAITQITSGTLLRRLPAVLELPTSPRPELLVVYETRPTGPTQRNIQYRRAATLGALPAAPEVDVAASATLDERHPLVARAGNTVVFVWNELNAGTRRWRYRRRTYTAAWSESAATWTDASPQDLSAVTTPSPSTVRIGIDLLADGTGQLVSVFQTLTQDIQLARLNPTTNGRAEFTLTSAGIDSQPWLALDGTQLQIFWIGNGGASVWHQAFDLGTAALVGTPQPVPPTVVATPDLVHQGCAVRGADGGLWLFWTRQSIASGMDIWASRRDPRTGAWGEARPVVVSTGDNQLPAVRLGDQGALWLFWQSNRSGNQELYVKRIVTAI